LFGLGGVCTIKMVVSVEASALELNPFVAL